MFKVRRIFAVACFSIVMTTSGQLQAQVEVIDRSVSSESLPPVQRHSSTRYQVSKPESFREESTNYRAVNTQVNRQVVYEQVPAASKPAVAAASNSQGELFYQLQLLQEEVRQLRGTVEEQQYQIKKLQEKSVERYIDLDKRLAAVSSIADTDTKKIDAVTPDKVATNKPSSAVVAEDKVRYQKAYGLVLDKKFDKALSAFINFQSAYPQSQYIPNSEYWLGELYQVQKPANLPLASQAFTRLVNKYPEHDKAPDAMYKLGRVYYAMGKKKQAQRYLEKTVTKYGSTNKSSVSKAKQFLKEHF